MLDAWLKCLENKFNHVRISPKENDIIIKKDLDCWEKIYDGYIDCFGIQDLYRQYLVTSKKLADIQLDYVIKGGKFLFNLIRVLEHELETIKAQMNKGISTESVLIHLGKWYGCGILRAKEIKAKEYFTLIKEYERNN